MEHDILAIWERFLLIFALDKLSVRHDDDDDDGDDEWIFRARHN